MKIILFFLFLSFFTVKDAPKDDKLWTENDRNYLSENLTRSKNQLIAETKNLTPQQWNFKESPDRWSIRQVVEHIAIYELLFQREISQALAIGPQIELNKTAKPDSTYLGFIMEEKPHITGEYTKPFTFTVPTGINEGMNNVAWFLKMRGESEAFIKNATQDLRSYYSKPGRPNIHQVYIYVFGHTDRHLRQIAKVKQHPNYPK